MASADIFARREGTEPGLAPVLVGSHFDTQMPGGKFDGPLLGVGGAGGGSGDRSGGDSDAAGDRGGELDQ
jgi:N-carbamoyl-L-amino-acid hydrolase